MHMLWILYRIHVSQNLSMYIYCVYLMRISFVVCPAPGRQLVAPGNQQALPLLAPLEVVSKVVGAGLNDLGPPA